MTRAGAGALLVLALGAALALRAARLEVRPMHHDEANQAIKFGELLERGEYRYDAFDHHGPTLYYLTLPAAWLRGQLTLAALDERTLRAVPAAFGAATLLLLPIASAGLGRTAVAAGAWLIAVSPAMVFYSRMFIQEAMFACVTLAFALAAGRLAAGGGTGWAAFAGAAAGFAAATKETAVLMLPAAALAAALAWRSLGPDRPRNAWTGRRWHGPLVAAIGAAAGVAIIFYSSFFTDPGGLLGPFRAAGTYLERGVDPADHVHPWHYYIGLLAYSSSGGLTWSEGLVLLLALAGALFAWLPSRTAGPERPSDPPRAQRTFWWRHLALYVLLSGALFSAIRYKTPWNLLPFYAPALVLAGAGFAALLAASRRPLLRGALVAAFAAGSAHLAWQAWRASVTYAADPRNPYVYAHTVPDAVRMAARIRDLAALHPDGLRMQVSVVAPPSEQWPLPWYLRSMPHVGYWTTPGDPLILQAPVVVSSLDQTDVFDRALGDGYVSEFFGLRPEVLLALYIERGLWDRFLARVAHGPDEGRDPCAAGPARRRCARASGVALWRPPIT